VPDITTTVELEKLRRKESPIIALKTNNIKLRLYLNLSNQKRPLSSNWHAEKGGDP
jgi:hypothetical protein